MAGGAAIIAARSFENVGAGGGGYSVSERGTEITAQSSLFLSLRQSYYDARVHDGCGVVRSIYRAIRWALTGKWFPA